MNVNILLLDDNEGISSSIKRLLRPLEVNLISTNTIERAMQRCNENEIQLVIADINRKDQNVNEFFSYLCKTKPLIRKLVLTGYADLESTVESINGGKINRYFTKPWQPEELLSAIVEELEIYFEHKTATEENERLDQQVQVLEKKVTITTRLAEGVTDILDSSRASAGLYMVESLLEQRLPGSKLHAKLTTRYAMLLTTKLGLSLKERDMIHTAAQLHQLGLLGLADELLHSCTTKMTTEQFNDFSRYPEIGAEACLAQTQNTVLSEMIHHHKENFNGDGFPSRLVGSFIPLGARIIRVASDFARYQKAFGREAAVTQLNSRKNAAYDPLLVDLLLEALDGDLSGMIGIRA